MSCTIRNGDCMELIKNIPDGSVDLIVCDPPYSSPVKNAFGREIVKRLSDLSLQEWYFTQLKSEFERVLKSDGAVAVFCDDAYFAVLYGLFYNWKNETSIVWDKGRIGMGNPVRRQHEMVFVASRGSVSTSKDIFSHLPSVIRCSPTKENHAAEKPVELLCRIVACLSHPGHIVLDPFMGSGSTGVACANTGRNFVGFELDEGYFEVASKRLGQEFLELEEAR